MRYEKARVIVLGASGFIGRWIARGLTQTATKYLVVRDSGSFKPLTQRFNMNGDIVELDMSDLSKVERFIREIRPSIVFNFAGYGVDPTEKDPHLAKQLNAELPRVLHNAIRGDHDTEWMGQHLVQPGSALEYGVATGILSEQTIPQPTTIYGCTKLEGTTAVLHSDIRAAVPRLFNIYGPGEHSGRLLPSLLSAAKTGADLELTPGTQKRDFTYVEDAAEGCLRLGLLSGKIGHPINLATGQLHSVRQFAEIASQVLNIPASHLRFGALPFRKEELDHEGVSVEALKKLINWTPFTPIAEGVQKTAAFFESATE